MEAPPPVSPSPRGEDVEAPPPVSPSPPTAGPSLEQELAELRGLLHELLEVSMRIAQRFGLATLHRELETLERVVRVWGGRYIRWGR